MMNGNNNFIDNNLIDNNNFIKIQFYNDIKYVLAIFFIEI